jgi:hypothetical protein
MAAPQLVALEAVGSSKFRAVFDQPMRSLPGSDVDPTTPSVWSLPSFFAPPFEIVSVTRNGNLEFLLTVSGPLPLGSQLVVVAPTVQGADGQPIDPSAASAVLSVTAEDLAVVSVSYPTSKTVLITWSVNLTSASAVQDLLEVSSSEVATDEQTILLTTEGTLGRSYPLTIEAVADNQLVSLVLPIIGQGNRPVLVEATSTAAIVEASLSERLTTDHGVGAYTLSQGKLTSIIVEGADVSFPASVLVPGSTTLRYGSTSRTVVAGTSWASQAAVSSGAATETQGSGTTTISKTSGAPYYLQFTGGTDSVALTGREWSTELALEFTPDADPYALMGITWLSTSVAVVIEGMPDGMCRTVLYRGNQRIVNTESYPFDLSSPVVLSCVDATLDGDGYFGVLVDGQVVSGGSAEDLLGFQTEQQTSTAFAVVVGDPEDSTRTFGIEFREDLVAQAFFTTGLRGRVSGDLVQFTGATFVVPAVPSPDNPGFADTGKGAFGVSAVYYPATDAVVVVVGLNAEVGAFTGTVSLLTMDDHTMDMAIITSAYRIRGENEVMISFVAPKQWVGLTCGVQLLIGGTDYSVKIPVTPSSGVDTYGLLVQQPASWYYPRLPIADDLLTNTFGTIGIAPDPMTKYPEVIKASPERVLQAQEAVRALVDKGGGFYRQQMHKTGLSIEDEARIVDHISKKGGLVPVLLNNEWAQQVRTASRDNYGEDAQFLLDSVKMVDTDERLRGFISGDYVGALSGNIRTAMARANMAIWMTKPAGPLRSDKKGYNAWSMELKQRDPQDPLLSSERKMRYMNPPTLKHERYMRTLRNCLDGVTCGVEYTVLKPDQTTFMHLHRCKGKLCSDINCAGSVSDKYRHSRKVLADLCGTGSHLPYMVTIVPEWVVPLAEDRVGNEAVLDAGLRHGKWWFS